MHCIVNLGLKPSNIGIPESHVKSIWNLTALKWYLSAHRLPPWHESVFYTTEYHQSHENHIFSGHQKSLIFACVWLVVWVVLKNHQSIWWHSERQKPPYVQWQFHATSLMKINNFQDTENHWFSRVLTGGFWHKNVSAFLQKIHWMPVNWHSKNQM